MRIEFLVSSEIVLNIPFPFVTVYLCKIAHSEVTVIKLKYWSILEDM